MTEVTSEFAAALARRYRLIAEVGRGGAATVWLAEDIRHRRKVAVKVLRSELAAVIGAERFLREIEIAAGLNHPHIVPLFDSGEASGVPYYVMPYVSGESLRGLLEHNRRLPVDQALRIGIDIAEALSFAHGQGVLHRDIKPENILVASGHPVITDFGIARAIDVASNDRLTMAGIAVGTPAYVSPEQASGDPTADARSDIYSLACVVYEMLAGEPPFTGATVNAIIAKRFVQRPRPLRELREGIPPNAAAAIARALERDPDRRFRTAAEFARGLSSEGVVTSRDPLYSLVSEGVPREASIAVLPFANMSRDEESEYFADGMTEELINALSHVEWLRVPARTSSFAFKSTSEDVRTIGQKLGVGSVLEGSIRRMGNRLRVTAQLINVDDGFHLWSERFDREVEDIFEIQDEISASIVKTVKGKLTPQGRTTTSSDYPLVRQGTKDPEAYHLYLKGRYYWYKRDLRQAMSYFEQAIVRDPEYALARCGLADTFCALGLFGLIPSDAAHARARALVERSLASDDTLAEVHYSRGLTEFFFGWDFDLSMGAFREAIDRDPRLAAAHAYLGAVAGLVGDEVTALDAGPRAQELEPLSPLISAAASMGYFFLKRFELTEVACRQAVAIDPEQHTANYLLGLAQVEQGQFDSGIEVLERAADQMKRIPHILMILGEALAKSGRRERARSVLTEIHERCAAGHDRPASKAWLQLHLGDLDEGFAQLEIAAEQRDPAVVFLLSWTGLAAMRADSRYDQLLERLSLSRYARIWHRRVG